MNSKIINLFSGPGAGKSSVAAGLTYQLKKRHISCDNPYEFPKVLAWDKNGEAIKDQLYVIANQHRGISKSYGKVDYIIMDSPILLSLVYKNKYDMDNVNYPSCLYEDDFDHLLLNIHNFYDNYNFFLKRSIDNGSHNNKERYQTIEESLILDERIKEMLKQNNIKFKEVNVDCAIEEIMFDLGID